MADGLRRYHSKTRNGCRQCKRRRVKCDCIGPRCSNCTRRDEICSYSESSDHHHGCSATRRASSAKLTKPLHIPPRTPPRNPLTDFSDLVGTSHGPERELMQHFLATACLTLSLRPDPAKCELWSLLVPRIALGCSFVRHSILAVSATHLCRVVGAGADLAFRRRHYVLACRHAIRASCEFRNSVREISEVNWTETIVFSVASAIFGLSVPFIAEQALHADETGSEHCPRRPHSFNIFDVIPVMRCARGMASQVNLFADYRIRDHLVGQANFGDQPAVRLATEQAMNRLDILRSDLLAEADMHAYANDSEVEADGDPSRDRIGMIRCYLAAVGALVRWIQSVSGSPPVWKQFVAWLWTVPEEYLDRLRARHPLALEIFAQWCLVMKEAPQRWYLQSWLDRALEFARSPDSVELESFGPQLEMRSGRGLGNMPSGFLAVPTVGQYVSEAD